LGNFVYITENLSIAGGDESEGTLESAVLSCFGNNLAKSAKGYSYDKEKLLKKQPSFILLNNVLTIEDLMGDEVYSQLDAVSDGKIIKLNNAYFEKPSARIKTLISEMQAQYEDLRIENN